MDELTTMEKHAIFLFLVIMELILIIGSITFVIGKKLSFWGAMAVVHIIAVGMILTCICSTWVYIKLSNN